MQFTANQYYSASLERMKQARVLYREGTAYALSMYCAGLAVESLLRAFRWKVDASFEGRHDLSHLFQASRMLQLDADYMRRKGESDDAVERSGLSLRAAVQVVDSIWHNNLRFASEAALKTILVKLGNVRGVKGNPLKKNAFDILTAAEIVINRGDTLWTLREKSERRS